MNAIPNPHGLATQADHARIGSQRVRLLAVMADGLWHTLPELAALVGASVTGVSARVRDLRKRQHGAHTVFRRTRANAPRGTFEYRLTLNNGAKP